MHSDYLLKSNRWHSPVLLTAKIHGCDGWAKYDIFCRSSLTCTRPIPVTYQKMSRTCILSCSRRGKYAMTVVMGYLPKLEQLKIQRLDKW